MPILAGHRTGLAAIAATLIEEKTILSHATHLRLS
jgi:hypothetical protein